jgi:hypothetical protein
MLGASVGTSEQRVLPAECNRADAALDGVVVEFDAAIIDEARQALPARQGVADGRGELAFLADQAEFCAQPREASVRFVPRRARLPRRRRSRISGRTQGLGSRKAVPTIEVRMTSAKGARRTLNFVHYQLLSSSWMC